MILKPTNISPNNLSYPSSAPIEVTWANNGDTMMAFEINIEKNSDGTQVFNSTKISSYTPKYTIPVNTLTDGVEYRFTIKVFNNVDASVVSDYKVFRCSSKPTVTIPNDGFIRNQVATISATYSQSEGVGLKCYKFILYDEFDNILEQSNYIYNSNLIYTFAYKLNDNATYKFECVAISDLDVLGSSGAIPLIADYIPPQVKFNLGAQSFTDKPYVRLEWTTVRIVGETTGITLYDVQNNKLDVTQGSVFFDEGFTLNGNFSLRLWFENPSTNVDLIEVAGTNGTIVIRFYDNKFHAFKNIAGITIHVATNTLLPFTATDKIFLCLEQIGKNLNLTSEVI